MGRISALTELTSLASDDYLVVLDSSANIAKKITIANAFGITDFGWIASGESWTYSSWTSGTRKGVITVPTDATTKYNAGMRIKITQSTGGTKYGIITAVSATTLTVFFPSGTTLNNEAITSPQYSISKVPLGFDADPLIWTLKLESTTARNQTPPTTNTWYNAESLALPVGAWDIWYEVLVSATGSGGFNGSPYATLSTANNSESDSTMTCRHYDQGTNVLALSTVGRRKFYKFTSDQTMYLNYKVDQSSDILQTFATYGATRIAALCGYL